jgi:hypothetical protein
MVSLKDLIVVEKKITLPGGGDLLVNGITLEGLRVLMSDHMDVLDNLFSGDVQLIELLNDVPEFCAKVISIAHNGILDYKDDLDYAQKLPFAVQLLALEAIWELSVPDGRELGKFLNRINKLPELLEQVELD